MGHEDTSDEDECSLTDDGNQNELSIPNAENNTYEGPSPDEEMKLNGEDSEMEVSETENKPQDISAKYFSPIDGNPYDDDNNRV